MVELVLHGREPRVERPFMMVVHERDGPDRRGVVRGGGGGDELGPDQIAEGLGAAAIPARADERVELREERGVDRNADAAERATASAVPPRQALSAGGRAGASP